MNNALFNNVNLTYFPLVSVITPVTNDSKNLIKLINALKNQSYPKKSFEIIVVYNSMKSNMLNLSNIADIVLVTENKTKNSYSARNKGVKIAKGEVLCFIDSDCLPDKNWLENGIKTMIRSQAHLVSGNIIFSISEQVTAAEYYDSVTNMQVKRNVEKRGVTTTANLFLKREVINKIGMFSEEFKSGGDIYYTALAVKQGFKLVYCSKAWVWHPARKFKELMKKAYRVGLGKKVLKKHINSVTAEKTISIKKIKGRHPFDHFNPVRIWKNLKEKGYKINILKLFSILFVSYCYLFLLFLSKKLPGKKDYLNKTKNEF